MTAPPQIPQGQSATAQEALQIAQSIAAHICDLVEVARVDGPESAAMQELLDMPASVEVHDGWRASGMPYEFADQPVMYQIILRRPDESFDVYARIRGELFNTEDNPEKPAVMSPRCPVFEYRTRNIGWRTLPDQIHTLTLQFFCQPFEYL